MTNAIDYSPWVFDPDKLIKLMDGYGSGTQVVALQGALSKILATEALTADHLRETLALTLADIEGEALRRFAEKGEANG